MFSGVPTPPHDVLVDHQKALLPPSVPTTRIGPPEATPTTLLPSSRSSPMERGTANDYSASGLPSPYPSQYGDNRSEGSSAEQSAAAAQFPPHQEVRQGNYSASATPTSDYNVYPTSARSGSFPEHIQRPYHPATSSASSTGMAQQPNNPSIAAAAASPTYPYGAAHSPYGHSGDMTQGYQSNNGMYAQARPDWANYGQHSAGPLTPSGSVFPPTPSSAPPQSRHGHQVYSFVPIPGAQQHKRPRRRYEEIERMYKCGWNGCEKAYGTLNHLNAHVTMQSHGTKRTPEEFKEIRKEWKQRKKEEEAQRKAEDERQRQAAAAAAQSGAPDHAGGDSGQPATTYQSSRPLQLPPIGYQPGTYPPGPPSATMSQQPLDYGNSQVYGGYPPHSPYGQAGQNMYNQSHGGQGPSHQ